MVPLCVGILSFALTQNNQPAMEHIYGWPCVMCFSICTHTCGVGLGVPAFEGGRAKSCSLHKECRAVEPTSGNRELLLLGLSF